MIEHCKHIKIYSEKALENDNFYWSCALCESFGQDVLLRDPFTDEMMDRPITEIDIVALHCTVDEE